MPIDPRIAKAFEEAHGFPLEPQLLVLAQVGSHSHGTYIPPEDADSIDDVDYMGFVVPPLTHQLGLKEFESWVFQFEELDVVLYSFKKAVRLLLKCNPNIVGMLWLEPRFYVHMHPAFEWVRARREIFSSAMAATSFAGYSMGQFKKMEAFDLQRIEQYEALTKEIEDAGMTPQQVLTAMQHQLSEYANMGLVSWETLVDFRKLHREHFSGYQGQKRKAMVRKYSYDAKSASHLIRLLRMGSEFLQTGELKVFRADDAEELMAIKRGHWTLPQVKAEAERLFASMQAAEASCALPPAPDAVAADHLLQATQADLLGFTYDTDRKRLLD